MMKIKKLEIDYCVEKQEPILADITLSQKQARDIVQDFFNKMDYNERKNWVKRNLPPLLPRSYWKNINL